MQIASPSPPARSVAPAPHGSNAPADATGGDFAGLLQDAAPEVPHAPPEPAAGNAREARQRAPARPAPARPAERPPAEAASAARSGDDGDGDAAEATEAAPDRQLLDWIAGLHGPSAAPIDPTASTAMAREAAPMDTALTEVPVRAGLSALASRRPAGTNDTAADAGSAGALRGTDVRDKAATAATAMAADAARVASTDTAAATKADGFRAAIDAASGTRAQPAAELTPAAVAAATQAAQAATPAADAAPAPVTVPLPTPLADPQFPRAFGVQVSVLARDGVQQAELHLNPAEMGPVAVQIVMDGTQARIEFGADAAGTRQLIENSLPDLAAALREAGLTLSGGGVSQHPSGREAATATPGPQREADAANAEPAAAAPRRTVRAGGVDVYA